MKTERTNLEIARAILADVYSCFKIQFNMNVDDLDSDIMIKVLDNHFDLQEFDYENINSMSMISENICKPIHRNPLKYFNFSYRSPRK
jgi:hypothetical protein